MDIQEIKHIIQQEMMNNRPDRSFECSDLFAALYKAQEEMRVAGKNSSNFRNKYADMAEIVAATRPALTKYGLSVIQKMDTDINGNVFLCTMLCHESGQWIDSRVPIRIPQDDAKNEIQAFGSAITYLRRYTYAALICCVTADESDDDGMAASSYKSATDTITEKQQEFLESILRDKPNYKEKLLQHKNISDLSGIKKNEFNDIIAKLRGNKSS